MYQGGFRQRWSVIWKKWLLRYTENKAHVLIFLSQVISNDKRVYIIFMSFLCLEAKMLKIETFILNYACFKHPWVLSVMSMLVDVLVTRQFFYFRAASFKNTFFPEHLQWVLLRIAWTLITAENFNNFFIGIMSTP